MARNPTLAVRLNKKLTKTRIVGKRTSNKSTSAQSTSTSAQSTSTMASSTSRTAQSTSQAPIMPNNNINLNLDSLIQNISNFEGKKDQDIQFFLNQFDLIAQAIHIPEPLKAILLKSKLAGHARQILINSPELRDEDNYINLKLKLENTFLITKSFSEAENKFANIRQNPAQSVEDYAKQFNIAAQKYLVTSGHADKAGAKDLLNTIKLTKFVDGLRSDIAFEIRKTGPDSFEQALTMAKKIEMAYNNKSEELNTISSTDNSLMSAIVKISSDHNKQMLEIQEQLNNLKIKPTQPNPPSPQNLNTNTQVYCHICEKNNHYTKDCYYNKKNENNRNIGGQHSNFKNPNSQQQRPKFSKNLWQNKKWNPNNQHNNYNFTHTNSQQIPPTPQHLQAANFQNFPPPSFSQNMPYMQPMMPLYHNSAHSAPNQASFQNQATNLTPNYYHSAQNWPVPNLNNSNQPTITFPNESMNQNINNQSFRTTQPNHLN